MSKWPNPKRIEAEHVAMEAHNARVYAAMDSKAEHEKLLAKLGARVLEHMGRKGVPACPASAARLGAFARDVARELGLLPVETDQARDEAQDMRAMGADLEQQARGRDLDPDAGRRAL
jgi:hypothetical protein